LKVAVLSDTHIPVRLRALPGIVYEVCAEADLIIHAGDIEDRDVITNLERFAPVKAVHGNMDGLDISQLYPDRFIAEIEGFRVGITHGSGAARGIRNRIAVEFQSPVPDIIIYGHTHEFFWNNENGIWFLNPGAVANPGGRRSIAVLSLDKGREPEAVKIAF